MNVIKEIHRINDLELENGMVNTPASWHQKYINSAWVYIGNLPIRLSEGDILAVMSQWGEVEDVNLVREEKTGKSKGFAFLKYEDARSCILAVDNLSGSVVLGRSLRVDHVENYRLPKHLREGEDGEGEDDKDDGDKKNEEKEDVDTGPGHAYKGKELKNQYDISQGQDLFAPVPAAPEHTPETNIESIKDGDGEELMTKEERKEAKLKRKEERDQQRREKEMRREEREEKRRTKRAKKHTHKHKERDSIHSDKDTQKDRKRRRKDERNSDAGNNSGSGSAADTDSGDGSRHSHDRKRKEKRRR